MGNLWLKIKVWTKITVASLIGIYLLIFVLQNTGNKASFWFWFGRSYEGSILYLILFTFLIGGLVAILATTTFRTMRQIREIRNRSRSAKLEREVADMKAKAAMLQTKPAAGTVSAGTEPQPVSSDSVGASDDESKS